MSARLPMFPLGTVLFPHAPLPLHVFEPRYRRLTTDCLAGDREFGVVLIERGSEVGGGDIRTGLGTVARIREAVELPDGRWILDTVGTRRIRVIDWLADDPYPQAVVDDLDDLPAGPDAAATLTAVLRQARRVLALRAELGDPAPPEPGELDPDPAVATWQLGALAGLGPADCQRALAEPGTDARLALLAELLTGEAELLDYRLRGA